MAPEYNLFRRGAASPPAGDDRISAKLAAAAKAMENHGGTGSRGLDPDRS